jgi:serine/threonine protein kinase
MSSTIGSIIGGKYKVVRKVGSGGMGSVYAAEKTTTHKLFALKFMNLEFNADRVYIERFKREIASLNAIRHPNVVNVFDWNIPPPDSQEIPYIVMELLEGMGLDELLSKQRRIDLHDTTDIMLQILDGLAAAHEVGVVHRDLGTSNVFLCRQADGGTQVKLLDFGLAKPIEPGEHHANITKEGMVIGKAAFAAPEIFHGASLDARSDIFACGMMMVRMLTGRLPYKESASHLLWVERYADKDSPDEYPAPSLALPGLPPSVDAMIMRAIRKRPGDRFADAREMQAALLKIEEELSGGYDTTEEISSSDLSTTAAALREKEAQRQSNLPPPPETSLPGAADATSAISSFDVIEKEEKKTGKGRFVFVVAAVAAVFVLTMATLAILVPYVLRQRAASRDAAAGKPALAVPKSAKGGPAVAAEPAGKDGAAVQETVHLVVVGAPKDASVRAGEVLLEGQPPEGRLPRGKSAVTVEVTAKGFDPYTETITPEKDLVLTVAMKKTAEPGKDVKKKDKVIKGRMGTTIKTTYEEN